MSPEEWNKSDWFTLDLFFSASPMARGFEGLEEVLEVFESLPPELRPDKMRLIGPRLKYSRQAMRKRFHEAYIGDTVSLMLVRSRPPELIIGFTSRPDDKGVFCSVDLTLIPFSFLSEPGQADKRAEHMLSFVRALASRLPLTYGMGHSTSDFHLSTDPRVEDLSVPRPIYETFWLNVYGPEMVRALGRERVWSTPATHMEELPGGAVLWLTRPTPVDFASEEARLAQARALVHLRPELNLESTLATLRQRSLAFTPIPIQFDPDVAEILMQEVEFEGIMRRRELVERFNAYRPPPVSEWLPASRAPASDVDDFHAAVDTYTNVYAEHFIAIFHAEDPAIVDDTPEALPRLDYRLWRSGWAKNSPEERREILEQAIGAWLGCHLVHHLGGRWVPRRKLEETAIIIGDRAWLPFLRARHALQGPDAPLDFSSTQLFRVARRLASH